jgi:hypothetical protein
MGDRDILDQESDYIGAGIQHHPDSKAHKAALKSHSFRLRLWLGGDGEIAEKR